MNEINLRRADLNLLVVFQVLLSERHVGRTARRLGLTQSAASHALGRLRDLFRDPLFVRHPKGIEPTSRALNLAPAIADVLSRADAVLASPVFDPSEARSFTIATIDLNVPTIVVPLIKHLRSVAPAIDLRLLPLDRHHVVAGFDRQEIDLAILNVRDLPARITRIPVLKDRFIGIARRGHPGLKAKPLTPKAYAALPHLLVSPRGDPRGLADEPLLQAGGLKRRVVMTVPHILTAPLIVANTDLVTLISERIARRYASKLNLMMFEPPIRMPEFTIDILISTARSADPALQWLRDQVVHVCKSKS
jgi:DNA-binding transcriptional LysR family regulator